MKPRNESQINLDAFNHIVQNEVTFQRYEGEYIALTGGHVINHDKDRDALINRLRNGDCPHGKILVGRVEQALPLEIPNSFLHFQS